MVTFDNTISYDRKIRDSNYRIIKIVPTKKKIMQYRFGDIKRRMNGGKKQKNIRFTSLIIKIIFWIIRFVLYTVIVRIIYYNIVYQICHLHNDIL